MNDIFHISGDPAQQITAVCKELEEFLASAEGREAQGRISEKEGIELLNFEQQAQFGTTRVTCRLHDGRIETDLLDADTVNSDWQGSAELPTVIGYLVQYGQFSLDQIVPFVRSRLQAVA